MNKTFRIAILSSHPIQYQVPLFRALSTRPEIDLTVFFYSDWGVKAYRDKGFGQEVKWDIPLVGGYHSEFLPNRRPKPNLTGFFGLINPGVISSLRNGKFDAVWIHGWSRFTDLLAIFTAIFTKTPILLRGETNLLPPLPGWKKILKRAILTRFFRKVSGFLAIGRYNKEFYEDYGVPKEKIFLVPYTVDNEFFLKKAETLVPQKEELKEKFGIPPDYPVIFFSGKLTPVKCPMDLLKAYREVSKEINAALIFVGDGILRRELESFVKENKLSDVYFAGFQNQTLLPQFYAMADIFVLPSGFEPWGLVVNEAMCFRLPIIATNQVGAAGDLIQEGINGYTYPIGQVEALTSRLKLLLTDEHLRQKMGHASVELVNQWSNLSGVNGLLDCLASLRRKRTVNL